MKNLRGDGVFFLILHKRFLGYHQITIKKTGRYLDESRSGVYRCVVCRSKLFDSDSKFDSRSGWPSFDSSVDPAAVEFIRDHSAGMIRTETVCNNCGAHLGHVFPDGPGPDGHRYCINGAALDFDPFRD